MIDMLKLLLENLPILTKEHKNKITVYYTRVVKK